MKITFHGGSCFAIKEGDTTVVTDPHKGMATAKASVVTVSDSSDAGMVQGQPKIFNWPGEYETGGVHFRGISSFFEAEGKQEENTIFTIKWNGVHLCHLGKHNDKLTPEHLEQIEGVDILFVPLNGKEPKKIKELIEQIEPRIVMPMAHCGEDGKCDAGLLGSFLSELGAQGAEPLTEFTLKKSELPEDSSKVVVLNVA